MLILNMFTTINFGYSDDHCRQQIVNKMYSDNEKNHY